MPDPIEPTTSTTAAAPDGAPPAGAPDGTPAPAPAGEHKTLGGGGEPTADPAADPAPSDDWRAQLAGDDAEAMTALSRFKSSKDFLGAFQEAQKTIRSGAHKQAAKTPPPVDGTPEEMATWRMENGVPADPKGYLEGLPDGTVLGEQDEEMVNSFLESAHAKNMDPDSVQSMLDWYANQVVPEQQERMMQSDKDRQAQAVETLREEWGTDFKSNLNSALNFLQATAPEGPDGSSGADLILGARLSDGSLAGDNPVFLKWLAGVAHEQNPAGFIAPSSGLTQEASVANEIAEIEKLMFTDPQAYYKDEAKQARLRDLYTAKERLSSKG